MSRVYVVQINLDNAAFEDGLMELPEILAQVGAESTSQKPYTGPIFDSNGNTVGRAEVREP